MFVQITRVRVPNNSMQSFVKIIQLYLEAMVREPGFVRSYFLEQVDDPNIVQLIQVWECQADLETFISSGLTKQVFEDLQHIFPGLKRRSQSYVASAEISYK